VGAEGAWTSISSNFRIQRSGSGSVGASRGEVVRGRSGRPELFNEDFPGAGGDDPEMPGLEHFEEPGRPIGALTTKVDARGGFRKFAATAMRRGSFIES